MLQPKRPGVVALLGLLATTVVSADERRYDDRGTYWSAPQVRLGVDVIWGGYGYAPPPRPVAWYPAYYPVYYRADRYYSPGHGPGYGPAYGAGYGRGHGKHRHRRHRGDD